jgi:hypothetical protein
MIYRSTTEITRSNSPVFVAIEHRRAELLGRLSEPEPKPPATPPRLSPTQPLYPPPGLQLGEAALYGLAGDVVRTLAPHTEAHPAAILLQLLAAFGNLVGPGPHCMVDATRHGLNLFVVLVGESSKARKGTSWNQIVRLFSEVDHPWLDARITTARLTASGLVYALRDQEPPTDRRLLAVSEEFAAVLSTLRRAKGHLSPLLRSAWDSGHLRTLDGRRPLQATGTHISLIAHITQRELAQYLQPTEAHNGFANRCLWTCVQRSQCLPHGGSLSAHELSTVASELRRAIEWAGSATDILFERDDAARELWEDCYAALSQVRPGLYGAATSRAEAQVLRLSAIYAALDRTSVIGEAHLQAALAVWDYCSAGASLLFGTSTGDPTADRIKEALDASQDGLSRNQIRALFHGHLSCERIEAALQQLISLGVLTHYLLPSQGGRRSTVWKAIPNGASVDTESIHQEVTHSEAVPQRGT